MPFHELLELEGCTSASVNGIQTWKPLCSQQPVFQVQVAHFSDSLKQGIFKIPGRPLLARLSCPSQPHQAPSRQCRFQEGQPFFVFLFFLSFFLQFKRSPNISARINLLNWQNPQHSQVKKKLIVDDGPFVVFCGTHLLYCLVIRSFLVILLREVRTHKGSLSL